MGLPLLLAAPALAAARGGLAVVVPLTAAPRDLARLRRQQQRQSHLRRAARCVAVGLPAAAKSLIP